MGFREKLQEINSRTKAEQSDIDFDEMVRQQKLQELKEKKLPLVGEVVFIDEANYPDLIIKPGQSFADALIDYKQRKKLKETVSDKVREMLDKEDEEARIEYSKFNYEMLPEKDRDFVLG
jgi:ribosomal protein S18